MMKEILAADKKTHRKQGHTAQQIFERLWDEHGHTGGLTVVRNAVREIRQRSS